MINLDQVQIETERLLLVPVTKDFAEDIFREFTPEITRHMFPRPSENIQYTLDYIRKATQECEQGESLHFAILKKDSKEYVGGAGAENINTHTPELGIWIKKSAHGQKYGKEVMVAVKAWIDAHFSYDYIRYPVVKSNLPSRKIAESLGGVVAKEYAGKNEAGELMDEVEYRIYPVRS